MYSRHKPIDTNLQITSKLSPRKVFFSKTFETKTCFRFFSVTKLDAFSPSRLGYFLKLPVIFGKVEIPQRKSSIKTKLKAVSQHYL